MNYSYLINNTLTFLNIYFSMFIPYKKKTYSISFFLINQSLDSGLVNRRRQWRRRKTAVLAAKTMQNQLWFLPLTIYQVGKIFQKDLRFFFSSTAATVTTAMASPPPRPDQSSSQWIISVNH